MLSPKPFNELRQTVAQLHGRVVTEEQTGFRNIGARQRHVTRLFWQLINLCLFSNRGFDRFDQILQRHGFAFPEIKDVPPRAVVIQRRDRALNNVVNVSVIALSRAIAELIDRLVGQNLASELMNRQIGTLPRSVNRKETQRHHPHLVEVRKRRTKEFAGYFGGSIRTDGLGKMKIL